MLGVSTLPTIYVDADSCPTKDIILELAKENQIEVHMFFDTSHVYNDGYSKVTIVDKGFDSVDYAIVNRLEEKDLLITNDYGLAAMALAKKAYAMDNHGLVYTKDNITELLSKRAQSQKERKHKNLRGPKKRSAKDDQSFRKTLTSLIKVIF
jgi:uncharacterized protein YaiI (UPF0178 family)